MPRMAEEKHYPPVPYDRHIFVCISGKTCPTRGAEEICSELRMRAKEAGITDRVRVNKTGCLNQCAHGPMMVIYPQGVWYRGVALEDVDEIFEKTVLRGEIIPHLVHSPAPTGGEAL